MTCKHCGKNIPDREVRAYVYSSMGKATGKSKARDPETMRAASLKRWEKVDVLPVDSFEVLRLPSPASSES
jgi:hypothetical protein